MSSCWLLEYHPPPIEPPGSTIVTPLLYLPQNQQYLLYINIIYNEIYNSGGTIVLPGGTRVPLGIIIIVVVL